MTKWQNVKKEREAIGAFFNQLAIKNHERNLLLGKREAWTKARGDAIERMTALYLQEELKRKIQTVQGGYCENCQNQIDVLILRKGARRKQYMSVYSVSSIIAGLCC